MDNQSAELTIFEENLTADGLAKIQEEAKDWPAVAENKEDYKLVKEQHQRFKRLRIACTKKASELIKTERDDFKRTENKIKGDLAIVMRILAPLEKQLEAARLEWDNNIKRKKEEAAKIEGEKQRIELERQKSEREKIKLAQKEEDDRLKEKADALKAEKEKLDRERKEFEIEKGRLTFDEAWEVAPLTVDIMRGNEKINEITVSKEVAEEIKKIAEPTEKAAEELNKHGVTLTTTDPTKEEIKELSKLDGIDIILKKNGDSAPVLPVAPDPAQKEKLLIKEDKKDIRLVNWRMDSLMEFFICLQKDGFQSKTATTELYRLIESVKEAAGRFKENLTPVESSPQKEV